MKLASHNSWSYLNPKKWWMKLIGFTAKCQDADIQEQYSLGVNYFDLRINFDDCLPQPVHGAVEYDNKSRNLQKSLAWLNNKGNIYVRVILDIRNRQKEKELQETLFKGFCKNLELDYPNITFCCGENISTKEVLYNFLPCPSCEEKYASVCKPRIIDDWYPRWFAYRNNRKLIEEGTDKEFLMLDFVNYQ